MSRACAALLGALACAAAAGTAKAAHPPTSAETVHAYLRHDARGDHKYVSLLPRDWARTSYPRDRDGAPLVDYA